MCICSAVGFPLESVHTHTIAVYCEERRANRTEALSLYLEEDEFQEINLTSGIE